MSFQFHSEAEAEFGEAYFWYENQSRGLGTDFVLCVNEAIERVLRNPKLYAPVQEQIRRTIIRRFPFAIIYEEIESQIWIIAVFHSKRNPTHWQTRK